MLLLDGANSKLQLITSAAGTIHVHTSTSTDSAGAISVTTKDAIISTATTTDIVPVPGASKQTKVKLLSVVNADASVVNTVTVQHLDTTPNTVQVFKATLQPSEMLIYIEGIGFQVFDVNGAIKQTNVANSLLLLTTSELDVTQRTLESTLAKSVQATGSFLLISGTAYCVYVGRVGRTVTINNVDFHVQTAGAGTQTAEVGLFSSVNAPNKAGQTLTKLVATGTLNALTGTGVIRNTTPFAQSIPAGTHLWAVIRCAMGTTQPTLMGLIGDASEGRILSLAAAGALTGIATIAGALIAASVNTNCPDLRVTLD